eukprot:941096-Rhodomonas_salina.2
MVARVQLWVTPILDARRIKNAIVPGTSKPVGTLLGTESLPTTPSYPDSLHTHTRVPGYRQKLHCLAKLIGWPGLTVSKCPQGVGIPKGNPGHNGEHFVKKEDFTALTGKKSNFRYCLIVIVIPPSTEQPAKRTYPRPI